jgi:hypothetical protein
MKAIIIFLIFTLNSFMYSSQITPSSWVPIFSCSGGSAHEVTAQILKEEIESQGIETKTVNVTRSSCTLNAKIGKFFTDIWDNAQLSGNVRRQTFLLRFQKCFEMLFYLSTYHSVKNILTHHPLGVPEKIILTSPLFLSPICKAVLDTNNVSDQKIKMIELYMVEAPSNEAIYYYNSLKSLSHAQRKLIRLFTLPPSAKDIIEAGGDGNYWQAKTGLCKESQIVYSPPLRPLFKMSEDLPFPGQAVSLSLKAQLNCEHNFLANVADEIAQERYLFHIGKEDEVALLMLGSIPSEEALFDYVRNLGGMNSSHKRYLFISCGHPKLGIYEKMLRFISKKEFSSILIPFTSQPVERIFARADMTITRSGGMTTQELLSLKTNPKREDGKRIFIHSCAKLPHRLPVNAQFEEELIRRGIPLWEAGNARYLKEKIGKTHIVNPSTIASCFETN